MDEEWGSDRISLAFFYAVAAYVKSHKGLPLCTFYLNTRPAWITRIKDQWMQSLIWLNEASRPCLMDHCELFSIMLDNLQWTIWNLESNLHLYISSFMLPVRFSVLTVDQGRKSLGPDGEHLEEKANEVISDTEEYLNCTSVFAAALDELEHIIGSLQ